MKKFFYHPYALQFYSLIILATLDRHYFFSLCYRRGGGVHTQFVPFYFNWSCFNLALIILSFTWLLLLILNNFLTYLYRLFTNKKQPSLILQIVILMILIWLLHLIKPFSLVG
ncbi:hypothetical protein [Legionella cardiaca]|uniref:Uncharacterized protein n=1 Tax=Legionella cardiaca TaxID=1071983 RepID=A0ABY8AQE7_9GAMM|nr:hypothetical protein [Legionella cardiaca]WED42748.1 hypothetical protein PXX05_12715 [Legionella cardiaca]